MNILFSEWLQKELARLNWTQTDLARKAGLTRQAISKYINQERTQPEEKALRAIAEALNYPVEIVLEIADVTSRCKPANPEFILWLENDLRKRNLTPDELANRAGIQPYLLFRILHDKCEPDIYTITAIAPILGASPAFVAMQAGILRFDVEEGQKAMVQPIAEIFAQLSEEDQQEILEIARMKLDRHQRRRNPSQKISPSHKKDKLP